MDGIELTNMVMITDPSTGKKLVIDRKRSWKGISFPGGHVEKNESFTDSAIREILEETGLKVKELSLCGIVHWTHETTFEKYLIFAYKTSSFEGTLSGGTEEGDVYWMTEEELLNSSSVSGLSDFYRLFTDDSVSEAFCIYNESGNGEVIYR